MAITPFIKAAAAGTEVVGAGPPRAPCRGVRGASDLLSDLSQNLLSTGARSGGTAFFFFFLF